MFRPTQALCRKFRKLPLTTKDVNKGYYKGTRSGRMGRHNKWGGYVVDFDLVRTYVVPKLEGFKLTPFVTKNILAKSGMQMYQEFGKDGPRSPELYLKQWKDENGKF